MNIQIVELDDGFFVQYKKSSVFRFRCREISQAVDVATDLANMNRLAGYELVLMGGSPSLRPLVVYTKRIAGIDAVRLLDYAKALRVTRIVVRITRMKSNTNVLVAEEGKEG